MRRYGWGISGLIHLVLALFFLIIRISLPPAQPDFSLLEFAPLPEEQSPVEPPQQLPVEQPEPEPEPVEAPEVEAPQRVPARRNTIGVRERLDWVTGPPEAPLAPIEIPERTQAAVGLLRGAVTVSEADWSVLRPGSTIVDTLLFAQQRLVELADSMMRNAHTGGRGGDRFGSPIMEPGTIENLRGEPFVSLPGVAAVLIAQLAEIGKEAWNRLIGRDPDALPEPDMDLTTIQVMAFAALDDRFALNIFEWHSRLHPQFDGGLSRLQQVAADLSERGLCRLEMDGDVFTYSRTVPLGQVIQYYVSFLSRLPEEEYALRDELIGKVAILVRDPGY
ncbi:hypothetical protein ACFL3H_09215 [Gemmatimonadota bacterium]